MPKTSEHPVPNIFQNLLAKILPSPVGSSNITLISSSSNFFDPLIQRKAPGVRPNHLAICPLGRCSHAESESEVKTIRFHSWKQASGPSRIFCLFKLQYVRVLILLVVVVESHYFFNDNYCWLPSTASPPSRLHAVTLSNKNNYKIQAKPGRCSGDLLLLLLFFFVASRTRILMTPL